MLQKILEYRHFFAPELLLWDVWRITIIVVSAIGAAAVAYNYKHRTIGGWAAGLLIVAFGSLVVGSVARPASTRGLWLLLISIGVAVTSTLLTRRSWHNSKLGSILRSHTAVKQLPMVLVLVAGSLAGGFHEVWNTYTSERAKVLEEMRRRPQDPWPRGTGHTMLSAFGVPVAERGWIEAGGSFSPSVKSFGLSLWIVRGDGRRVATSDDINIDDIQHRYRQTAEGSVSIEVYSPYYTIIWRVKAANSYSVEIENRTEGDHHLELAIRSVGPAGGPVTEIRADAASLKVEQRWSISIPNGASVIGLGDERLTNLQDLKASDRTEASSHDGWAFARIKLPKGPSLLDIVDTTRASDRPVPFPNSDGIELVGFPAEFGDRLAANRITLLSGVVGSETRPGDPINYPLSWQRDGAYFLTALARSGHGSTARRLAEKFATEDFFGGFGAEADAPGLALWGLGEVATSVWDPAFDVWAWPHIVRKANLIKAMLVTTSDMRASFTGPVVPKYAGSSELDLVARPGPPGLIEGRMDWHWPLFYVNAVSYLGLVEASGIARRLGKDSEAAQWTLLAGHIKDNYRRTFATLPVNDPDLLNPRTTISGLWPADIADPSKFIAVLSRQWLVERMPDDSFRSDPLWTYFSFAQAHQWLRLGQVEPVQRTLHWFDRRDLIPGLQVFWEGNGEENSFGLWRNIRGYTKPSSVSPHYWTSSEVLLLLIEMLSYVDQNRRRLVLGAGVPISWLASPLTVRHAGTSIGPISWTWNGNDRIEVETPIDIEIELGPSFPANVTVERRITRR